MQMTPYSFRSFIKYPIWSVTIFLLHFIPKTCALQFDSDLYPSGVNINMKHVWIFRRIFILLLNKNITQNYTVMTQPSTVVVILLLFFLFFGIFYQSWWWHDRDRTLWCRKPLHWVIVVTYRIYSHVSCVSFIHRRREASSLPFFLNS